VYQDCSAVERWALRLARMRACRPTGLGVRGLFIERNTRRTVQGGGCEEMKRSHATGPLRKGKQLKRLLRLLRLLGLNLVHQRYTNRGPHELRGHPLRACSILLHPTCGVFVGSAECRGKTSNDARPLPATRKGLRMPMQCDESQHHVAHNIKRFGIAEANVM